MYKVFFADFYGLFSPSSSSISNPSATPPAGLSASGGAGATPTSMPVLQPAPNNPTKRPSRTNQKRRPDPEKMFDDGPKRTKPDSKKREMKGCKQLLKVCCWKLQNYISILNQYFQLREVLQNCAKRL